MIADGRTSTDGFSRLVLSEEFHGKCQEQTGEQCKIPENECHAKVSFAWRHAGSRIESVKSMIAK